MRERRTGNTTAVHKAQKVSNRFAKLPKNTVGSFIMTFHTEAATDLFGLDEGSGLKPQNGGVCSAYRGERRLA